MEKNYIFLLLMSLLFISCNSSRDDDNSLSNTKQYYVKFKINDVQKEDYYNTSIGDFNESSIFEVYPMGGNLYTFQLLDIIAVEFNRNEFQPKTYSWSNTSNNNNMNFKWFKYIDPQTGADFWYPYGSGSNVIFNIISVNNNEVKGTFTGKIIASSNGTQKTFNITNGEFYAPIIQ